MKRLKAIIFDMDGVITLSMPYHYRAWAKIFAEEGVRVSKFEVYRREGQKGLHSVLEIFAECGKPMTMAKATDMLHRKEKLFKKIIRTKFVPGIRSFIKTCHRKGLKIALVTGTARNEVKKMLPKDMLACFDVMVCGEDVDHGKPHPEPYQKAICLLKVSREGALVVENAPFGITSALKAGLKCVAIETSLPKSYLKDAHLVIKHYNELHQHIAQNYTV